MADDVSLPDTDLRVQLVDGGRVSERDMMLFEGTLSAVWDKIPRRDRQSIASHWQIEAIANEPVFILDNPWFGDPSVWATAERIGLVLKFNVQVLNQVSEHMAEVLGELMAHEMAHVFQWATGKDRFHLTTNDLSGRIRRLSLPLKEDGLVELHADETMLRWGFDPNNIDAWAERYFIVDKKTGQLVPRKKPLIKGAYTRGRRKRMWKYYDLASLR